MSPRRVKPRRSCAVSNPAGGPRIPSSTPPLHSRPMADYDPNVELNPNPILLAVVLLVLAGFGVVYMIVATGDAKPAATSAPAE